MSLAELQIKIKLQFDLYKFLWKLRCELQNFHRLVEFQSRSFTTEEL